MFGDNDCYGGNNNDDDNDDDDDDDNGWSLVQEIKS